ncbi:DUF554 domain-containing protein [Leptolyngbya ohadii]|uniref:DUF554 domain-containing protein n=1 Tax=Leptolyngbya ohadii TaxID=1962290 RepID=UPI000B59EB81|nr:DUF554 domain-containing protein [Leptolyngbya ohadii]
MTSDLWLKTSGTWINVATILLGTLFGLLLKGRLPIAMQRIITQGVGLITLFVGSSMAASLSKATVGAIDGVILGLVALVLGGLLGEVLRIEAALEGVGNWLKYRFKGQGSFTEGFVAASLLFCVGPMALIGSLNNGLTGDGTLVVIKAAMDGLASIALTSSYGMGVGFSALPVLLYQGLLSLAAGGLAQLIPDPATAPPVMLSTGVGGLMILGLGLNLLEVAQVKVASFLPGLFLAPLLYWLAARLAGG